MRNFGSIFAAYMIAWAIFFLYQTSIARRLAQVEEELRRLRGSGGAAAPRGSGQA